MKTSLIFKFYLFLFLPVLFSSCQKEGQPRTNEEVESRNKALTQNRQVPLKGSFKTYFNFIPDIAGGWTPPNPAPAWYPGGGEGNLTHLGTCRTYFNQYATIGAGGLQSAGAPLNMFFAQPLSDAGYTVPNSVTTIYYTSHGQSVWSSPIGLNTTKPISATRVEFVVQHQVLGGTGRFANATGEYLINGFFNPQDPTEAGLDISGWIRY